MEEDEHGMHGSNLVVKDTVAMVKAHSRSWRSSARMGDTFVLVNREEEDGVGGVDSAGKGTTRGEHKVEEEDVGPKCQDGVVEAHPSGRNDS